MAETACNSDELTRLLAAGDEKALERIAACYLQRLTLVGRCACRDDHSADDAVQEALLIAAQRIDQFRGDGSALAWLSRIVVNACRCQKRGRKNDPRWNQPMALTGHTAIADETPEDAAVRSELAAGLADALEILSESDRALFVTTQLEGETASRAAARAGSTPEAIRARLTRIRRRLRTKLQPWRPD